VRALFLLLLLANLLFLAWSTWIVPNAPLAGAPTPSAPDNHSIHLLREAPVAHDAAAAAATAAAVTNGSAAACVAAGPFLERVQAEAAARHLAGLGFKSRPRAATEDVKVGQWVRVPNLATPEDAANALAALKAAGLTDAEIVSDGTPGNTISIGVFKEPARASSAVATARKAGFAAEVSDRTRQADVWWLDVDRQENGGLPTLEALGVTRSSAPPLELRACPAATKPAG